MITTPIALDTLGSIAWTAADLLALGPLVTDGDVGRARQRDHLGVYGGRHMSVRFVFHGLEDLKADLRRLPADLAAEGGAIVRDAGKSAFRDIDGRYATAEKSGNLRKGLRLEEETSAFGVHVSIRSTAKHAYMYENGTMARHTALGIDRGAMPPAHVVVPTLIRVRYAMYQQLAALIRRKGLRVTGDAAA